MPWVLQGVGEPPLLLAMSVLMAVRHAITAARMDAGLSPLFPLDTPATPARIRMACADHFTRMVSKSWNFSVKLKKQFL